VKKIALYVALLFTVGSGFSWTKFLTNMYADGIVLSNVNGQPMNGAASYNPPNLSVILYESSAPAVVAFDTNLPAFVPLPGVPGDSVQMSSYTATTQAAITAAGGALGQQQ
jgi:hypothetical protein